MQALRHSSTRAPEYLSDVHSCSSVCGPRVAGANCCCVFPAKQVVVWGELRMRLMGFNSALQRPQPISQADAPVSSLTHGINYKAVKASSYLFQANAAWAGD